MSGLLLGIRMPPKEFQRLRLEEVNFDLKVDNLKDDISTKTSIPRDTIELVYCGNILDDESTLSSSGLRPGVMVHVLKKKGPEPLEFLQPVMSDQDIKALVLAFRTLTLNPTHRNSLQKLSRPDILENIIMVTPGLSKDPVAIALILDPELMVRLANFDTVRRIVEFHPALAEAANHIAATVHEEAIQNHNAGPSTSSGYSLLDFFSDDDDMESSQMVLRMIRRRLASRRRSSGDFSNSMLSSDDDDDELESSQSSDSVQPGVSRQPSFSGGITTAQLAAALNSASQNTTPRSGTESGESGSGAGITSQMFSNAMQRVMVVPPLTLPNQTTPTLRLPTQAVPPFNVMDTDDQGTEPAPAPEFADQLRQMRELGLTNDVLNLQALTMSNGNVNSAIDLVFSGVLPAM